MHVIESWKWCCILYLSYMKQYSHHSQFNDESLNIDTLLVEHSFLLVLQTSGFDMDVKDLG